MTQQRLKIASGASNPFLVSVPGIDVNSADFANTLFDANQSPLRVVSSGNVSAPVASGWNIAGVSSAVALPATPSGTYPCIMLGTRASPLTGHPVSSTALLPSYHINNSVTSGASTSQVPSTGQGAMWGYSSFYGANVLFGLNFQINYTVTAGSSTLTFNFDPAIIAYTILSNYG